MNKKLLCAISLLLVVSGLYAQYPKVPREQQAKADSILNEEKRRSEEAFQTALLII